MRQLPIWLAAAWAMSLTVLGLMVLFGLVFCATAYVGYRGLEILSYIAVPAMMLLLMLSMLPAMRLRTRSTTRSGMTG